MAIDKYILKNKAVCPFYQYSTANRIACEGYGMGGVNTGLTFGSRGEKKRYQDSFCSCLYSNCIIYICLEYIYGKTE